MSDLITSVDETNFDIEVMQEKRPVLVDFWADWCGPCKMIAPLLEEVAKDYIDRLKVVKINVDQSQELAVKYGVRGIPNLLIIREGAVVASQVGSLTKSQLIAFVDEHC